MPESDVHTCHDECPCQTGSRAVMPKRRCEQCNDVGSVQLYDVVTGDPNGAKSCPDAGAPWHAVPDLMAALERSLTPRIQPSAAQIDAVRERHQEKRAVRGPEPRTDAPEEGR